MTKRTAVTVAALPDRPPIGVCLYCWHCGSQYSAHRGDYFLRTPDHVMRCSNGHSPVNLLLVEESVTRQPWTAEESAARLLREGRY